MEDSFLKDTVMSQSSLTLLRDLLTQDPQVILFKNGYLWDETNERLYLIKSNSARLSIPKGPIRLKLLQESHDCFYSGHIWDVIGHSGSYLKILTGQEWASM